MMAADRKTYMDELNKTHPIITLRLDDLDIKEFLETLPKGQKSKFIKDAIRSAIHSESNTDTAQNNSLLSESITQIKFLMEFFQNIGLTDDQRESITDSQRIEFRKIVEVLKHG